MMRTTYQRPDAGPHGIWVEDDEPQSLEDVTEHEVVDTRRPELVLLLAVLERAILDLGGQLQKGTQQKWNCYEPIHEAFEWVTNTGEEAWTFIWVCEQLHLHPMRTQRRVFELAENLNVLRTAGNHDVRGVWKDMYARTH